MSNLLSKQIISLICVGAISLMVSSCSSNSAMSSVVVGISYEPSALDPQSSEDYSTHRVVGDLFEGLLSYDQNNEPIPGLAERWQISQDGKTYIFHLRKDLKFSDGTPITANDVVFTWRRLVSESMVSPYKHLLHSVVNANNIINKKLPASALGVIAINPQTVRINLQNADSEFLKICALRNLGIVSEANVTKFGPDWTKPKNMVSSGAYILDEIENNSISISRNPNYYGVIKVSVPEVKFVFVPSLTDSLQQYKAGKLDITQSLPVNQYANITQTMPEQLHTVNAEDIVYIDFNMLLPKLRNNKALRKALTMAIDRNVLVKKELGQEQNPLYSYTTPTIDSGRYDELAYDWSKKEKVNFGVHDLSNLPEDDSYQKQLLIAKNLFEEAGYGPQNPFKATLSVDSNETRKKIASTVINMWKAAFGNDSIQVTIQEKGWKTFLADGHSGNFSLAMDHWSADYDSVYSYTALYQCNNEQNFSHYCNVQFDKLIEKSSLAKGHQAVSLVSKALLMAQDDYPIIPLYQDTYYRLINPQIKSYVPEVNHLDHVQSKWY